MPLATNPQTGESVYLTDDGQWQPAPRAKNPQTGEEVLFDGKAWSPVKPHDVGQGRAALEGYLSGASANFRDEIYGASKASGLPDWMGGFRAPVGAARLAYEGLTAPGEATATYQTSRDEMRGVQKQAQEQYPKTYLGAQIGGAFALPGGAALQGATLPARMARGAAVGATYGAASGFGEGEGLADSATKAAIGAPIGAVVGAVAQPVVEGVARAGGAVANRVGNTTRTLFDPEAEASRRIVTAIQRDAIVDPGAVSRLTPQELSANLAQGGPGAIIDVGGETTRDLGRYAANVSPEARFALERTVNDRFEGQSTRFTDWLNHAYNFPDAEAQRRAIEEVSRTVNRPLYDRAYRESARVPLWDAELEQMAQAPVVQNAIRIATPQLRNWAVMDGFRPPVGAFDLTGGRTTLRETGNGNTILPSLQYWDYVKRALDNINTPEARAFSRALREKLDEMAPSYRDARAGASQFFRADNAVEAGQNFVAQNFGLQESRRVLNEMSIPEQQLFRDGFVARFVETLDRTGDRRNVLNMIAASPAAREKLDIALGPQGAAQLEARLRVEEIMNLARTAVTGNSTTARQQLTAQQQRFTALGLAGGAYGVGSGFDLLNPSPSSLMAAALTFGAARGANAVNQRMAQRIGEMLASNNPTILTHGIQLLAQNRQLMQNVRNFDLRIAGVGGQQAPRPALPAPQGAMKGTAEDEQPKAPGPVN